MSEYNDGTIKVQLQSYFGNDRSIADAAWTSSSDLIQKQARSDEDVARIINMLADSKHSVPFESIIFRFWIRLPIATDRQHITHRIGSHSGLSGRYRTMPSDYLKMPDDIKSILASISKSSLEEEYDLMCQSTNDWYQKHMAYFKDIKAKGEISNQSYKRLREFLRGVLPQHNMTERVSIMNLRSFANYYRLRSKADAQPEIQVIAKLMHQQISEAGVCPIAFESLERNSWNI